MDAAQHANPLVVLWAGPQQDDETAMSSVRQALRAHGVVDVITYDPESPAIVRASRDAQHPEWLNGSLSATDRVALARSLGAVAAVTITAGDRKDSPLVEIASTVAAGQVLRSEGRFKDDVSAIENAAEHPAAFAPTVPATPIPDNPVPAPVTPPATPATGATIGSTSVAGGATIGNTPVAGGAAMPVETATPPKKTDDASAAVPVVPPAPIAPRPVAPGTDRPATAGTGDSPDNPIVVTARPVPAGGGAQPPVAQTAQAPNQEREQLDAIAPLIAHGDQALDRDEVAVAISYYRQAVDGAPLLSEPRLKLAKAYLQGGFEDKALDEAKRALLIAPNSVPVQEFLIQLDANGGTASGTVTLYETLTAKNPQDIGARIDLGDAYWNAGSLDRAEAEYKTAESMSPKGDIRGATQLVRLYAAQARYGDVLPALKRIGPRSYPIAARVIHSRLDTLISTISSSREAFDAGKSSHEEFYDTAKTVSAQAAALADFVDKVQPPSENRVSHLHLSLAASLIAQEAEVLRTFVETSDADTEAHAVELEKSAQTEILTAHAAEEKAGLFVDKT